MSIQDEIKSHIDGELFLLTSEFGGEETPRTIFYSVEVQEIIEGANSTGKNRNRFASAKAVMDAFIDLGEVTFGMDPHNKAFDARMARTDPLNSGIVDFRVLDPKPGIRVFGCFSELDTFVALTWGFREEMDQNGEFESEVVRCRQEWLRLFPNFEPHYGVNVNDYISQNWFAV